MTEPKLPKNIETLDALIAEWENSTSLDDACLRAGIVVKDRRQRMRLRRRYKNSYLLY